MKRVIKLNESVLNRLVRKILKEDTSSVPQDLITFLKQKGFQGKQSSSSYDFSYGDDNEGLFVIFYKDFDDSPLYMFRLTGGQNQVQTEPFKKLNPKKVFDKKYNISQIQDLKRDIEIEMKKVKIKPRA